MDLDRLCDCRAPMMARCFPMDDRAGRDVMVVVAKITYAVDPSGAVTVARPPSPVRLMDIPVSDSAVTMGGYPPNPRAASILYPSDLFDEKPGTDVMLVGTAHPPPDRQATEQVVGIRVEARHGTVQKAVKVYGPRVWQKSLGGVVPGPPALLSPTPLIYELAFGGSDDADPSVVERRNPSGTGRVLDRLRLIGLAAPAIEDPGAPLTSRAPAPAGLGPIAASWEPRASRAGTRDEAWRRERAPIRPADFDPRFYSSAPPELWSETPLVGDEPVEVLGATPAGAWRFRLPAFAPHFRAVVRGRGMDLPTHLDTYLVDADRGRVELTWRAALPLPRRVDTLESMQVFMNGDLPEGALRPRGGDDGGRPGDKGAPA